MATSTPTDTAEDPDGVRLEWSAPYARTFLHVLVNTLVVSLMNFTIWFAITFFVFLQTRSVFATGMVAGIYLAATGLTGIWFGSLVDRLSKKTVMQASVVVSVVMYVAALVLLLVSPAEAFTRTTSVRLWAFIVVLMMGVLAGNIRTIALPTLVTLLIPEAVRDRANGLVGSTAGASFLVTSVISGLLMGLSGMAAVIYLAIGSLLVALVHLQLVPMPDGRAQPSETAEKHLRDKVDQRGTNRLVRSVQGLTALIVFSAINNLLGGAFMALIDAYGLSLVSVQTWGLLWGLLSTGFIVGGLLVARIGLSDNPVRVILIGNLLMWLVTCLFPLRNSVVVLAVGMYAYMLLAPFIEAAEQTVLQRVVPYERQGRVFGFALSVEQAASPLTAFLIGPLTQFAVIPFMTDGWGAQSMGSWFGTGPDRGIALVFVLAGVVGVAITAYALGSRFYRRLRDRYLLEDPVAEAT